ncbi:WbqC family protein [bacterium]|nr:WbqC family protein [bacterium]
MRVSIHQPHYLPWLPYLGKIALSDCFVILDDVEFTRNGWQNRNKIKTAQGPLVLTAPVKQKLGQFISQVEVADNGWRKKHWASLQQAYRKAPYFAAYEADVQGFYANPWPNLVDPCSAMIEWLLTTLGLSIKVVRSSTLKVTSTSTQRLVDIVQSVGGHSYLSGSHALQAYLDPQVFVQQGMPLHLFDWSCPTYPQLHTGFTANLAVLDALFNVGPELTREIALQGSSHRVYGQDPA